jgi:hypothetical protein
MVHIFFVDLALLAGALSTPRSLTATVAWLDTTARGWNNGGKGGGRGNRRRVIKSFAVVSHSKMTG